MQIGKEQGTPARLGPRRGTAAETPSLFSSACPAARLESFPCGTTARGRCLTGVDADEGALGDVVQATDAPTFVLGLEELKPDLQAVLDQAVGAHVQITLATLVTLVHPGGKWGKKRDALFRFKKWSGHQKPGATR